MVYIPGQKLKGHEKGKGLFHPFFNFIKLLMPLSLSSVRLAEGPLWGRGTKGENRCKPAVFNLFRLGAHFGEWGLF